MNNIDNLVGQNPQNFGNGQPIHPQKRKAQQLSDVEIKNFKETNDPTQPKSLHFRKVGVFTLPSLERESYNESLQEFRGFTRQLVEELYENKISSIVTLIHSHIGVVNGIWTSITNTFKEKFGKNNHKLYLAYDVKPEGNAALFVSLLKKPDVNVQNLTQDEQIIYEWLNNDHFKDKSLKDFYKEKVQSLENAPEFSKKWMNLAREEVELKFKDNIKILDDYLKSKSNFETLIKENLFRIVDSLSGRITHLIKGLSDSGEYKKVFDQLLLRISKQIEAENKASETVTEYDILYKKANRYIAKAETKRLEGKPFSTKEQKDLTYWQDFKKKIDDFGGIDAFKDQIRLDFAKRALEEEQKDEYSELVEDLFSIVFQDKDILNVIKQFSFLPETLKKAVDELKIITNVSTADTHLQKIHSALSLIETGCNLGLSYLEKFLVNQAINKVSEPSFLGDIWENSILPNVRNALIKSNLQECITKDLKDFSEEFSKYLQLSNQAQEFMTYCVSPLECFTLLGSLDTVTPAIFAQIKAKELNEATKDLVSHLKFQYSQFKSFKDFELFTEKLVQKIQSFETYPQFANFLTQNNQALLKFNDIVDLLVREKPSTLYFDYDKDISQKELNHLVIEYVSELTKTCYQVNPNDYSQDTVVLILKEQFKAKHHGERSPAVSHLVKQIAVLFNIPQWAIDVLDWSFVQKIVEKNLTSALSPYRDTPYAIINTSVDAISNKNEKQSLESLDSFLALHALSHPLQKHLLEIEKFKSPLHAIKKLTDLNTLLHNNPPIDFSDLQEHQWEECLNRLQCNVEDFSTVAEAQNFAISFLERVKTYGAQSYNYFSLAETISEKINFLIKNTPHGQVDELIHFIIEITKICEQVEPNFNKKLTINQFHFIFTNYLQTKSYKSYATDCIANFFDLSPTLQKKVYDIELQPAFTEKVVNYFEALDNVLTFHSLIHPLQKYLVELEKFKTPLHAIEKFKNLRIFLSKNTPDFSDLQDVQWEKCLEQLKLKVTDFCSVVEAQKFATSFLAKVKINRIEAYNVFFEIGEFSEKISSLIRKAPQNETNNLIDFIIAITKLSQQIKPELTISQFHFILTNYKQTIDYKKHGTAFVTNFFKSPITSLKLPISAPGTTFCENLKHFFELNNNLDNQIRPNNLPVNIPDPINIEQACANIFYDKIYKSASSIPILGKHLVTKILGVDTTILSKGIERIGNFFKIKAKNELLIKDATKTLLDAFATKEGIQKSNFQIVKSPTLIPPLPEQKRNRLLLVVRIIGNIFFGLSEIIIAIAKAIRKTDYTPTSRQRFLLRHVEKIDLNREESVVVQENQEVEPQNIENNEPQAQPVAAVVAPQKEYNFAIQALNTSLKGPIIQAVDYISQKYLSLNNFFGMNLLQFADKARSFTNMIADIFARGLGQTLNKSIVNVDNLANEAKAIIAKYSPSNEFTDGLIEKLSDVYEDITEETFADKEKAKIVLDSVIDIVEKYVIDFSTENHKKITDTIKQFLDDNIILLFESIFEKFNDKIEQIGDSDWRKMFDEIVTTFDHQVQAATETTKNKQISLIQVLNDKTLIHTQLKSKLDLENRNQNLSDEERLKIIQKWEQEKFNHIIRILIDSLMNEQAFIAVWDKMKKPTELINYINLIKAPFKSSAFKEKFDSEDIRDFSIGMAKDALVAILGSVLHKTVKDMSEAFYWQEMAGENLLPKVVGVLNEIRMVQTLKADKNYSATLREAFILNDSNKDKSIAQLQEELATANFTKVKEIGKISESQLALLKVDMTEEMKTNLMNQALTEKDFKEKYIAKVLAKFVDDIAIDTKETTLKEITTIFESGKDVQEQLQNYYFQKLAKHLNLPNAKPHPLFLELINKHIDDLNGAVQLENCKAKKDGIKPSIKQAIESFYRKKTDSTEIYRDTTVHLLTLGGMNPGSITSTILSWLDPITPQFQEMRKSHHWLIKMIADQFTQYFNQDKVHEMIDGFFTENKKETEKEKKAKKIAQEPIIKSKIEENNIAIAANVEGLLSNVWILNKWGARTFASWTSGVDISPKGFYNAFENIENELFKDSLLENMLLHVLHRVLDELSKPRLENVDNKK